MSANIIARENYKAVSCTKQPCDWTPMIEQYSTIDLQDNLALTLPTPNDTALYNANYVLRIIQSHDTEQYKMPKISKTTA